MIYILMWPAGHQAKFFVSHWPHHVGVWGDIKSWVPGCTSPNPRHLAVGWLSGLRVRECVLCTYSYAGVRLADWLVLFRVRA